MYFCARGLISSEQNFVDNSKPGKCETVDIHSEVPRHVETVVLLSKLNDSKQFINVKVDMEELDITYAESKATYEEIREWIKETYGFKVSNLNIAQTKRKCGIIERDNYNLSKDENSIIRSTPKEKTEAIMEAFKYYQMI